MKFTLLTLILAGALASIACNGASSESGEATLEVSVGPARQECYGPFRRMCLVVDGQLFYSEIDGFTHEPGHQYRLRIERYDAFPGQAEPPQDAGRYGYRLIEELSRTLADGEVTEATVAPARVTCPKSDDLCLLVNGAPSGAPYPGSSSAPATSTGSATSNMRTVPGSCSKSCRKLPPQLPWPR